MNDFPEVPLGEVLRQVRKPVLVDPLASYRLMGVKGFGRGPFFRQQIMGSDTTYKFMQQVRANQLVYSALKAWEGAIGLVSDDLDGSYVSSEYPVFEAVADRLHPQYVGWYFKNPATWLRLASLTRGLGARRERVRPERFLQLTIPLPSIEEQKRICTSVALLAYRTEEAEALETEIAKETDGFWWSLLRTTFSEMVDQYAPVHLEDVALINPETVDPASEFGESPFQYIDISAVTNGTGAIVAPKEYTGLDAPSRARRRVRRNDILISTVRPYLRGFALVPAKLDGQVCSTGFAVLRPQKGLLPKFLLYQALSGYFVEQLTDEMRGGHYPAVRDSVLRRALVVCPSSDVQSGIIDHVSRVGKKLHEMKQLQRGRRENLQNVLPSILRRAFSGQL